MGDRDERPSGPVPGSPARQGRAVLTMFLKWALRVPVVWWYSMTQQLLRISPLQSLRVFSFLSRDLACCSLMMVAFTCGGFMCTFSFPPTSRRTVAANLVWVFRT